MVNESRNEVRNVPLDLQSPRTYDAWVIEPSIMMWLMKSQNIYRVNYDYSRQCDIHLGKAPEVCLLCTITRIGILAHGKLVNRVEPHNTIDLTMLESGRLITITHHDDA